MTFARSRRWGARYLLGAWVTYWVALAVVVLGGPAVHAWRLTHDAARHGSITARLADDVFAVTMVENGATVWAVSARLVTLALWIAGPPLVLFLLWLRARPAVAAPGSDRERGRTQVAAPVGPDQLVPATGDEVPVRANPSVASAVGRRTK